MARIVLSVLLIAATPLVPANASGQGDVPDMITDRPDVTESSQTVPRAYFQLETEIGFDYDRIVQNRAEVELSSFHLLDGLAGFALTDEGNDWFGSIGLSFRLPG